MSTKPDRVRSSRRHRSSVAVFPGVEQSAAGGPYPWLALCGVLPPQMLRVFVSPCLPVAHRNDGFRSKSPDEPERRRARELRRRHRFRRRRPSSAAFPVQPSGVLKSR